MNQSKIKILTLIGMPGSGKSTCSAYFAERGFSNVYFGGITIDTVKERGLEVNEANERAVRESLRKEEGMAVMAKRSVPKIDKELAAGNLVVIDDMYSFQSFKFLKDKYGEQIVFVAVVTPRARRYEFLKDRPKRPLNADEATSRDYSQIENLDIGGSIAIADHYLLNTGTLEDLTKAMESLLKTLNLP